MSIQERDRERLIELIAEVDAHLITAKDKGFNSNLKDMLDELVEFTQKQTGGKECD
jgi:hypothetical protein